MLKNTQPVFSKSDPVSAPEAYWCREKSVKREWRNAKDGGGWKARMPLIDWYPHIGDPTVIGWTITVAYFFVAFLCYRAGLAARAAGSDVQKNRNSIVWFGLGAVLLGLGINKQLDLQTLLIHLGRERAKSNDWYGVRREIQLVFVLMLATLGLTFTAVVFWMTRGEWRQYWPILIGVVMVVAFVLIRAASFDHVNYLLSRWRIIGPFKMKYVVEFGGVMIIGLGALKSLMGKS